MKLQATKRIFVLAAASLLFACGGANDEAELLEVPEPVTEEDSSGPTPTPEPTSPPQASVFYLGNDLSYVNEMEDCGVEYRENDIVVDPYELMAKHGSNLVRVRLWNEPWWQALITQDESVASDRKAFYSDLADVTETIRRAKEAGMSVMLGMHFSDFWADPGRQATPRAWESLWGDDEALGEALYDYVTDVLTSLNNEGLLPDIVKLGNESNQGILNHPALTVEQNGNLLTVGASGSIDASEAHVSTLWNQGIKAVRDFSQGIDNPPQIALHVANAYSAVGFMEWVTGMGVTDFDIIGFSYYYGWHEGSIAGMAGEIRKLRENFPNYYPMLLETGYPWDTENIDNLGNIISQSDPSYSPLSKQNQLKYLVDLTQATKDAGGIGVVFWEPAWVSSPCRTPWGQGSSHEHVAYFDHRDNLNFHYGGQWMNADYLSQAPNEGLSTSFFLQLDPATEIKGGVHIQGSFTEDKPQPMVDMGSNTYRYSTYIADGSQGTYHYLLSPEAEDRETVSGECTDGSNRTYSVSAENREFSDEWGSCNTFNPRISVIFNVDMSAADFSNGAFIAGEFNSWSIQEMTALEGSEGVFTLEAELTPGLVSQFYFLNHPTDWDARETVPAECALAWDSDRQFTLPQGQDTVVYNLVWGSCETFENEATTNFTVNVDMSGVDVSAGAFIAGDLTDWQIQPMNDAGNGIFSITLELAIGDSGGYYILNDPADWEKRETVPVECVGAYESDRGFEVTGNDVVNITWSSCEASAP